MYIIKPKREIDQRVQEYRITGDYHTHTVYSCKGVYRHGKGIVEENALAARRLGIKEIAITDHGPALKFYGLKISKVPRCIEDIEKTLKKYSDMKIFMSVEANIIDTPSGIDIEEKDKHLFDFIIAGYHYGCAKGKMIGNMISFSRCMPSGSYERLKSQNTDNMLKALYMNDIKILTHPCDNAPFDRKEVWRACEDTDTLVELNNRHDNLSVEDIGEIAIRDIKFVISSDAHKPEEVGRCEIAMTKVIRAGLDISRVVNMERRDRLWK